jgi:ABC-type methionine transport system ATPase subunit
MLLNGVGMAQREARDTDLLARVGLGERGNHHPSALSGGEQQRVAIAVALANEPSVLFADEPTGELDSTTAHEVFDLLRTVNQELGVTIVVVTHDPLVSEQVTRTIAIRDGRTSTETLRRRAISEAGDHHVIAEELAVLDRAGRLQLPRAHVETLGLERRVRLVLEDDHIEIWPDRDRSGENGHGADGQGGERP